MFTFMKRRTEFPLLSNGRVLPWCATILCKCGMMRLVAVMILLFALQMPARAEDMGDELASILQECLQREAISPDSIEYNLQLLEQLREAKSGVQKAVYTASLAQLYAMRAYSEPTGAWMKRSRELFREALSDPKSLYAAKTRDWLPLVKRGKDERIYGRNMLYVVWRAANEWAGDSIMTEEQLVEFCAQQGNEKPAKVMAEIRKLEAANDSIQKRSPWLRISMAEVYYPGDSLRLKIDSANISKVEWRMIGGKAALSGKNPLTAPTVPGRYMLELTTEAEVRLRRRPRKLQLPFVVSRLQAFSIAMPGGQPRVTVVDAWTGKPTQGADIERNQETRTIRVKLDADSCLREMRYYGRYAYSAPAQKPRHAVAIYTDRAVYRPGQQVYITALLYSERHWDVEVMKDKECRVRVEAMGTVRNEAQGRVLCDTLMMADDYGTLAATVHIPEDTEPGQLRIAVNGSVQNVSVEEYRRPTFYVELDKLPHEDAPLPLGKRIADGGVQSDNVQERDTAVHISGRAMFYDGTPVRSGRVTVRSSRVFCWWWRRFASRQDEVMYDTLYTDVEGRFSLPIHTHIGEQNRYAPWLKVEASVLSPQGETQRDSKTVRLFADPLAPQTPVSHKAKNWAECPVDTFDASQPALLEFRNREGNTRYIFLTAFAKEKMVMDTLVVLADTLCSMPIPWREEYADGLAVSAVYVERGQVNKCDMKLYRRLPEKRLLLHWDTFRDFTRPGDTEQWTLRVTNPKGEGVPANVMVCIYDASLDAIAKATWGVPLRLRHHLPYTIVSSNDAYNSKAASYWQDFDVWTYTMKQYDFSHLDMKFFQGQSSGKGALFDGVLLSNRHYSLPQAGAAAQKKAVASAASGIREEGTLQEEEDAEAEEVDLRSDFDETALFAPQLRTDEQGYVTVSFSVPQSLTTWAINLMAHTKDMSTGTLEQKIVAKKALTARLHLPRFVREKDRVSFSVMVSNEGDASQQGTVLVEVLDAVSGKLLFSRKETFALGQSKDSVFTYQYFVPEGVSGLRIKAVARAQKDSDGELRELPVLSAESRVSKGKAFTLNPGERARLAVTDMFPAQAQKRLLIVEKVEDPIQEAVDALKKLSVPEQEDVLSRTSAFYATCRMGLPDSTIYINKVYTMQKEDGSLPWYDGLAGNAYLTLEAGYMLARLGSAHPSAIKVEQGIRNYLARVLQQRIAKAEDAGGKWVATYNDLRMLYVLLKGVSPESNQLALAKKVLKHLPAEAEEMDSESLALAMIIEKALGQQGRRDSQRRIELLRRRLQHSDGWYLAYRGGALPSINRRLHIHTQVMEAWQEVLPEDENVLWGMREWLLNQKRTQGWHSTMDCIDAVYALTQGDMTASLNEVAEVKRDTVDFTRQRVVFITNEGKNVMWAAALAEYSLPMDKVEAAQMDIAVERRLSQDTVSVGDKLNETLVITAERDYEYVHLRVPHAGCTEAEIQQSGYSFEAGLPCYRQIRDAYVDYFFPSMPHGKYVLRTERRTERAGQYSMGVPTIKCCYAEEMQGNGENTRLIVK